MCTLIPDLFVLWPKLPILLVVTESRISCRRRLFDREPTKSMLFFDVSPMLRAFYMNGMVSNLSFKALNRVL